jgi:hypothetical protein
MGIVSKVVVDMAQDLKSIPYKKAARCRRAAIRCNKMIRAIRFRFDSFSGMRTAENTNERISHVAPQNLQLHVFSYMYGIDFRKIVKNMSPTDTLCNVLYACSVLYLQTVIGLLFVLVYLMFISSCRTEGVVLSGQCSNE